MEALCIKMEKYQDAEYQQRQYQRNTVVISLQKLRSVVITQTHTRFCSRFRICVTNMYFATDAISVMLGSVMSVLRCQRFFYCLHSHTSAVNSSEVWNLESRLETLQSVVIFWIVTQTVSQKRVVHLLALCQTHSVAHLLISYSVSMSLSRSLHSLSPSLTHSIILSVYIHIVFVFPSSMTDFFFFMRSFSSCDYVQSRNHIRSISNILQNLKITAICQSLI